MNMAVYDDAFEKTIEELPYLEEGKVIKGMLKHKKVQCGEINPRNMFENSMVVNCMAQKKSINAGVLNNFLNFLK